MATRTDHVMRAAVRAAKRAKLWTKAAAREADRLLQEARKEADSEDRRRRRKQTLLTAGRVLKAAGEAALVAGLMAGIAAVRSERSSRRLPKGRGR
jgi:cell division septum initiation protein DivIVA